MENQDITPSLFDLKADENVKQQLRGAAHWGGIAALVSMIVTGLGLVNYIVESAKPKPSFYRSEGFERNFIQTEQSDNIVSVVISLIIGIFLFIFLNRFSKNTKAGIDGDNQELVTEGLGNLSTYFKIIGVLLIIILVLFGLALLMFLVARA